MNHVVLRGRIGTEIKVTVNDDNTVSRVWFMIGVKNLRKKEDVYYNIPCVAFNSAAAFIERKFKKGDYISIQGFLETYSEKIEDESADKKKQAAGEKEVYKNHWQVIIESVEF
ncbi:MAG: single-stranded DNA-binding protein [Eubacteriales bacterium]|nr:single-stranded DNA-binding protein [Eubacteriales bacterium]